MDFERCLDPSGYAADEVNTVGMSSEDGQCVEVPVAPGANSADSTVNARNDPSRKKAEVNQAAEVRAEIEITVLPDIRETRWGSDRCQWGRLVPAS